MWRDLVHSMLTQTGLLDDLAVPIAPIAVPDQALIELARRVARQLFGKVDRARAFDLGKLADTIFQQFRFKLRSRSEEHTSELQSLMRISYAVLCLKKKKKQIP